MKALKFTVLALAFVSILLSHLCGGRWEEVAIRALAFFAVLGVATTAAFAAQETGRG